MQLNIYSYTERGYVRLRQGDLEGAFTDFNVALAISKDNPENYRAKAYAGRAQVAFERKEDERALADLDEAIRLDPTDAELYFARSQVFLRRREVDRAIVDLNEALRLQPTFAQAYAERGFARREKGELAQALADFNRAIRINPRNARFYESRGVTYGMQGDFAKATTDFRMVLQLDPHYPHADDILAWLAQHGVQQRPLWKLW